ncbi:MAG: hypothetical protein GF393_02575 [Armatimonadia bacterium]|nr:hypothetical protein [Armatimonadia bacterium]
MRRVMPCALIGALLLAMVAVAFAEVAPRVSVNAPEPRTNRATWECDPGHEIRRQQIALDSGERAYTIQLQGCWDPSHGDQHPCNEGTFGMPRPTRANWYAAGFMKILINGANATLYQNEARPPRVLETGDRGVVQFVWEHPAAEVGLRLMMLPEGNHLLADLQWREREGQAVESVALVFTCYPSYFTTANNRTGDRRVRTPRTEQQEGSSLDLVPAEDTWLYYFDTVFDVANGEGDGPCALMLWPEAMTGGRVSIGGYAVSTTVNPDPAAGQTRLGLYDFTGLTNAEAGAYMDEQGAADLAQLGAISFRPEPVRELDLAAFTAETERLLAAAAEDGDRLRPEVEALIEQVAELKPKADAGDWTAEADLAELLQTSADLFWKLKTFAVLNG